MTDTPDPPVDADHDSKISEPSADPSAEVVAAAALFQGRREVVIEHEGVRYRLRITRRGKLILQK